MTRTRKLHQDNAAPLDPKIHVAEDGIAVCSLGAWIGNNINDLTPWEAVLDKIIRKLEIWARFHPTVYRKRLISPSCSGGPYTVPN